MIDDLKLPEAFVIAIDGPAGSGKSTLAKRLSMELGAVMIDTGAMYRSATAIAMDADIDVTDEWAVVNKTQGIEIVFVPDGDIQKVIVNGADYTKRIREPEVSSKVSIVAAHGAIRDIMTEKQRQMGANGRIVMEGRDIGSNVFPNAEYKFFLVADDMVRAKRRMAELGEGGREISIEEVLDNIRARDRLDSERTQSPLVKAEGAIEIDTSNLNIDEVLSRMINYLSSGGQGAS
jgi:cytidylate kinase